MKHSKMESTLKGRTKKHTKYQADIIPLRDITPNIGSSSASDAKHMDIRLKPVLESQHMDDVHKNMRPEHVWQKPTNA